MKTTVLLADDNIAAIQLLAFCLNEKGFNTHQVYSAKDTIQCLRTTDWDVAILDISFPDMSKQEFIKSLRESYVTSRLIILSGYDAIDIQEELNILKPKEVLKKPATFEDVIAAIERILSSGVKCGS